MDRKDGFFLHLMTFLTGQEKGKERITREKRVSSIRTTTERVIRPENRSTTA